MSLRLRRGRRLGRRALHRRAHILAAVHFAVPIGVPAAVGHLTVARHLVALLRLGLGRLGRQRAMAHGSVLRGACGGGRRRGLRSSGRGESKSRGGGDKNGFHVDSPDRLLARRTALSIDQEILGGRGSACGVSPRSSDGTEIALAIGNGASGSASRGEIDGKPEQRTMQSIKHSRLLTGACLSGAWSCGAAISAQ